MKIESVDNYRVNSNFCAKPKQLSKAVIDRLGINMETQVGYKGDRTYVPAPVTLSKGVVNYMHMLEVDWRTHVDPNAKKYNW